MDKLPFQVVLGTDLPIFWDLIAKAEGNYPCVSGESMMAVSRSKHQSELSLGWNELPFADTGVPVVEGPRQGDARKSRMQRRQDKVRGTKIMAPEPKSDEQMAISVDMADLQRQDPSLAPLFSKGVPNSTEVRDRVREVFLLRGEQLYHRSRVGDQLVVPKSLSCSLAASIFCTLGRSLGPPQNLFQNDSSLLLATAVLSYTDTKGLGMDPSSATPQVKHFFQTLKRQHPVIRLFTTIGPAVGARCLSVQFPLSVKISQEHFERISSNMGKKNVHLQSRMN